MSYLCMLIGIILGSFICASAYRFIHHESIIIGRSHCEYCNRILNWYELIPILSYIGLKGKCRTCHHNIRMINIIAEILGGLIFIFSYYEYGLSIYMIIVDYICLVLLFIGIVDYMSYDVYIISLIYLLIGICFYLYLSPLSLEHIIHNIIYIFLPLCLITIIIKDCIGIGDLQFILLLCLFFTPIELIKVLLCAIFVSSSHIGIYYTLDKHIIPFMPYLVLGCYLILLF